MALSQSRWQSASNRSSWLRRLLARGILTVVHTRPAPGRRTLAASPFAPRPAAVPAAEHLAVNDRVTHDRFGMGRVVAIVDDVRVLVDFGSGAPVVSIPHLRLTRL